MLICLSSFFKSWFKFSFSSRDDKSTDISLSDTLNHIRNIILMTWSIQNCKSLRNSLEKVSTDFNSFTFFSLLFVFIHNISKIPRLSVVFFSKLFKLFDFIFVKSTSFYKNTPTSCRFSTVYMTNENDVKRFSGDIRFMKII